MYRLMPIIPLLSALIAPACAQTIELKSIHVEPITLNSNLVPNFSFEDIEDGRPTGWTWSKNNTDATFSVDSTVAHSGKSSIKITNGTLFGPNVFGAVWRTDTIPLQPGKPYTISAWIKSDDSGMAWIGGGSDWQVRCPLTNTSGRWKRVSQTFTPGDADAQFNLRINTDSPTKGFWIDDIKLESGSEASPVEPAGETTTPQISPMAPQVDIQGDGDFNVQYTLFIPQDMSGEAVISLSSPQKSITQPLKLAKGSYKLTVTGNSQSVNDLPRTLAFRIRENGNQVAAEDITMKIHSSTNALARLDLLKAKLPKLKAEINKVKSKGQDVSYPMVTYTVIENFIPYAAEDAQNNEVIRALAAIDNMEKMALRLDNELKKAISGKRKFASVPRWTGNKRPIVENGSFIGEVATPGKPLEENRPIFFNGYGHFGQVVKDMEKWPNYGTNIIQIEIGPSSIFPAEGQVDMKPAEDLLPILDRAQKAGVGVCLLISPHYFPEWMMTKYPYLKKNRLGFQQYCTHAPEGQKLITDYIKILIPVIKDHPALNSICLSNEPVNPEEPCEFATQEWHTWLAKHHQDVATLNSEWQTSYKSFDDVPLPNPLSQNDRNGTSRWMEFVRFNQEFFAGWHKILADAVHSVAPNLPVHAKAMSWTFVNPGDAACGVDAYLFSKMSDINGNDSANMPMFEKGDFEENWQGNALTHDLQRSAKNAPVFNTENHLITDRETREVKAEHIRSTLWQAAIGGQCATAIWVWERAYDPKADTYGSIMHRPACAEAVGIANYDMNRAAWEITAIQRAPAQVQILQSTTADVLDGTPYASSLQNTYTALSFTGLKLGLIEERQLEDGILPTAPVLVIPYVKHLSEKAFQELRAYKGQVVMIGGGDVLSCDEYNRPRTDKLSADRIDCCAMDPWRSLWKSVMAKLPKWNTRPQVQIVDTAGQPIWGVIWRGADVKNGAVVNICNERQDAVNIKLIKNGKPIQAVDVLTGEKLKGAIKMAPLEVRLVRIKSVK